MAVEFVRTIQISPEGQVIRCRRISISLTKCPLAFLFNFNITRVSEYTQLRTVPTNSKVFLRGLLNMREKKISTNVIEIQKENWG